MKNIQIIDGTLNCTFSIFQATDEEFALLLPEPYQNIQYAEDLEGLPRQEEIWPALNRSGNGRFANRTLMGFTAPSFTNWNATRNGAARSVKTP